MSENPPTSNGANGDGERGANGRFLPGNKGGPGNPAARYAREVRERLNDALFKTCSPDRLLALIDALLRKAEAGDVAAARLLLERIAGPPVAVDLQERLESVEELVAKNDFDWEAYRRAAAAEKKP
ncbi:MAG TPA: hypothetical protein VFE47_17495 [Tepidisphaeraceae bacterium]|jgi:hypothetical protein|nr:hypothetical protein [Tepidisphaeraceae bacterium]